MYRTGHNRLVGRIGGLTVVQIYYPDSFNLIRLVVVRAQRYYYEFCRLGYTQHAFMARSVVVEVR